MWSSVSLSAALILGMEKFDGFQAGAAEIDQHFYQAEPVENICFVAAMLDHYYANFWDCGSRAIFAYDYRLRSLMHNPGLTTAKIYLNLRSSRKYSQVIDPHQPFY